MSRKRQRVIFILVGLAVLLPIGANARQPYVVGTQSLVVDAQPSVSRAYYGELSSGSADYRLTSSSDFVFYVNLLVPKIAGARQDFFVVILRDGKTMATMNGSQATWKDFYEPFGGDHYLQGPEYRLPVVAGTYDVLVMNSDNRGKYVLVIGEERLSLPSEMIRAIPAMPAVKRFFGRSGWAAVTSPAVLGLLAVLVVLTVGVVLVVRLIRKQKGRPQNHGARRTPGRAVGSQPSWKRPLYLALSTLLGLVASFGVHAAVELWYLSYASRHNLAVHWTSHFGVGLCALPLVVQDGLLIAGVVGGFFVGRVWWRWVYVEGRRWRRR